MPCSVFPTFKLFLKTHFSLQVLVLSLILVSGQVLHNYIFTHVHLALTCLYLAYLPH